MNECPIRVSSQGRKLVWYLFIGTLCVCIGCERGGNQMAPLPPHFNVSSPDQVPMILVGQVLESSHAAGPPQRSQWDGRLTQLWKVRVRVERVLQGQVQPKEVDIFYFPDMDAGDSPVARVLRDLYVGHSEIFFLQRDHGKLRTICDGWRTCIIWVRTGSHYNFKTEPGLPIEDAINRLLLSRGDHGSDEQMIDAIYHPEWRWGTIPVFDALKELAAREKSPSVKAVICERLRNFQTRYGPPQRLIPRDWYGTYKIYENYPNITGYCRD